MTETTSRTANINADDPVKLQYLATLTKKEAETLVKYRNEHGLFKSWEDLKRVDGFTDATIKVLKDSNATLGGIEEEGEQIHD
jgi:competence protein ComEA